MLLLRPRPNLYKRQFYISDKTDNYIDLNYLMVIEKVQTIGGTHLIQFEFTAMHFSPGEDGSYCWQFNDKESRDMEFDAILKQWQSIGDE